MKIPLFVQVCLSNLKQNYRNYCYNTTRNSMNRSKDVKTVISLTELWSCFANSIRWGFWLISMNDEPLYMCHLFIISSSNPNICKTFGVTRACGCATENFDIKMLIYIFDCILRCWLILMFQTSEICNTYFCRLHQKRKNKK